MENPVCVTLDHSASIAAAFEHGSLSRSQWNHRTYLAVAFWYQSRLDESDAKRCICQGIQHYNHCQGIPNTPEMGTTKLSHCFGRDSSKSF
jgi:hypothetical protein